VNVSPALARNPMQNYLRYHFEPPEVLRRSSLEIAVHLRGRGFRFIHIDGSPR
jgi:hypothetical protein